MWLKNYLAQELKVPLKYELRVLDGNEFPYSYYSWHYSGHENGWPAQTAIAEICVGRGWINRHFPEWTPDTYIAEAKLAFSRLLWQFEIKQVVARDSKPEAVRMIESIAPEQLRSAQWSVDEMADSR